MMGCLQRTVHDDVGAKSVYVLTSIGKKRSASHTLNILSIIEDQKRKKQKEEGHPSSEDDL